MEITLIRKSYLSKASCWKSTIANHILLRLGLWVIYNYFFLSWLLTIHLLAHSAHIYLRPPLCQALEHESLPKLEESIVLWNKNILFLLKDNQRKDRLLGQKIEMIFKNFNCDLNSKRNQRGLSWCGTIIFLGVSRWGRKVGLYSHSVYESLQNLPKNLFKK